MRRGCHLVRYRIAARSSIASVLRLGSERRGVFLSGDTGCWRGSGRRERAPTCRESARAAL